MSDYIIRAADIGRIGAELGERLANYLRTGDVSLGLKGLDEGPILVTREGTTQALFVWNGSTSSFEISIEDLNKLHLSVPAPVGTPVEGWIVLPRLIMWKDGKWVSAYESDLENNPYMEIDNTLTVGKISYQHRSSMPMPYDPEDGNYPSLLLKPGSDMAAPVEGAEGDWSEDEWIRTHETISGLLEDLTQTGLPQVVFFDDDPPGVPHVRIARMLPTSSLEPWGEYHLSEWTIVITIHANPFTGSTTKGLDADSADLVLGGAVWQLVGNYEGLKKIGLTNSDVKVGSPVKLKMETTFPITISCEVYSTKPVIS